MAIPVIVLDTKGRCNNSNLDLSMDEACFDVRSNALDPLTIWSLSTECEKCSYIESSSIPPVETQTFIVNTKFPVHLYFSDGTYNHCYERNIHFQEYGRYGWNISSDGCSDIYNIERPQLPYLSLVVVFFTFFILTLLSWVAMRILRSEWLANLKQRNVPFSELESDLGTPSTDGAAPMVRSELLAVRREKTRMRSLDVFRGFLWIMGVSMALSLRSQLRSSVSRWKLFKKVLCRSIILVALGILLNSIANAKHTKSTSLASLRLPGVLQRIGLSYFIVATLETLLMKREFFFEYGPWLVLQDVLESWLQWLVILGLVAAHTCLTFLLPVEGCPTGYLGPGGRYNYSSHPNCTGGAAGYIDRMVFRNEHLYQKPTCYEIYQTTLPYDPEGLLGTLTSILMVYLGVQAGRITLCYHYAYSRVVRWMTWAVITGLLAGGLCDFSRSDGVVPVNKNLWSVSYVLATASLAFLLQCILYIWVDVKRWMSCHLFRFAGMNAILLYVGHELTHGVFPWGWQPYYHTHTEHLLMALWGSCLWVFIAFVLFKRNIFLTI
uniref:Heparan-alpha-glucosaminide N-acetyltransferase n=1 Tax=Timema tahoe TaxID=61484 RepID=A0A7R9P099_9NEOP|nr:unnamed protein product [Timema tahoe]